MTYLRLEPTDPDLLAALAAGLSWQMAIDGVGISQREALGVVRRLPLHLNTAGRLENTGFLVQCLARTVLALQQHVAALVGPAGQMPAREAVPTVVRVPEPEGPLGSPKAIRAWAKAVRMPCNATGRVNPAVVDAYRRAHGEVLDA